MKKTKMAIVLALITATAAIAAVQKNSNGKLYSQQVRVVPALAYHDASSHYLPLIVDSSGVVQTTTIDSSYTPVSTQTVERYSGSVYIDTGDGVNTQAFPLGGMDTFGLWHPIQTDGSGKLMVSSSGGAVSSVFGRSGAVTAQSGDYSSFYLLKSNNLSDLASASTARTNLGLGTAATQASSFFLQSANNLSDVASPSTARTNLGLGSAATANSANLTEATSSVLTITGGSNSVLGSGTSIQVKQSSGSLSGYLSSGDWTTFNAKQNAIPTYLNTYWVNKAGTDSGSCGSVQLPCLTISQALTNIGVSPTAAEVKNAKTVIIGPGNYDESLTIPSGRVITLLAQGMVVLGDGQGANWNSTTPRNISWNPVAADLHGSDVKPALTIGSYAPADATSTFIAESHNFTISGNLTMNGDGTTKTLNLHGVKIWGALTHTDASLVNWQSYRSLIIGAVTTTGNLVLERAYDSRFNALVSVNAINMAFNSNFAGGITVQSIQQNLLPNGFFSCNIAGTFTGPANSLRLDTTSDFYFRANSATLAGGATKTILSTALTKYAHLQSQQTTPPTALVSANAGTGSTCTVTHATDSAGQITIATGTVGVSTGDYCDITFNSAYSVAPICSLTPAGSTLSTSVYVTSSTSLLSVNFSVAGGISSTYVLNYQCIETQ